MIQFIKEIIRNNLKNYRTGISFLIIYYVLKLFSPIFVKLVIDKIGAQSLDGATFQLYAIVLIVSPILLYLSCFIWGMKIYDSANALEYSIRKKMMHQFLSQFPNFFKKYSTGTLMGRATDNLTSYTDFAGFGMMSVLDGFVYPIFVIILMIMTTNISMTIVALLPIGLLAFANTKIGGKFDKLNERISKTFEKMNDAVLNYTNGLLTIRSYRLTTHFYDAYVDASKQYQKSVDAYYRAIYTYMMFGIILPSLSVAFTLMLGYHMIVLQQITVGSLIAFMIFIRYLEWPMSALSEVIHLYSSAKVGKKLIDEILNEPLLLEDGKQTLDMIQSISFQHFHYEVDGQFILKDIDFEIKKGDFIGVVGKTGSGKSTLLKQLLRLNPVAQNTLYINGVSIENYTIESIRNQIAYVAQEHTLFSKTIEENIAFGKPIEDLSFILKQADIQKDVDSFIDKEKTVVGEKGIMLSGGQKQRISLARALNKNSPVYILDDCLSALDNETQENIINHLQENIQHHTLFIASHRLSIFKNATKIIVLDNGEIVEQGTHLELMEKKGWYYTQFTYQKEGNQDE